jgi:hypothetical protein
MIQQFFNKHIRYTENAPFAVIISSVVKKSQKIFIQTELAICKAQIRKSHFFCGLTAGVFEFIGKWGRVLSIKPSGARRPPTDC